MVSNRTGDRSTSSCVWSSDKERVYHLLVRQDTSFNFCPCTSSRRMNLTTRLYVLVTVFRLLQIVGDRGFFRQHPENMFWSLSKCHKDRYRHCNPPCRVQTLCISLWQTNGPDTVVWLGSDRLMWRTPWHTSRILVKSYDTDFSISVFRLSFGTFPRTIPIILKFWLARKGTGSNYLETMDQ